MPMTTAPVCGSGSGEAAAPNTAAGLSNVDEAILALEAAVARYYREMSDSPSPVAARKEADKAVRVAVEAERSAQLAHKTKVKELAAARANLEAARRSEDAMARVVQIALGALTQTLRMVSHVDERA